MNFDSKTWLRFARACALAGLLIGSSLRQVSAQWPFAPPPPPPVTTTRDAQRHALNGLRSQINFFENATRTASNYGAQGYGNVLGQFQSVRAAYNTLKQTLNSDQLTNGANPLAELDAGLDIIQEAFTNYENDVNAGRSQSAALRDMCQVLRQSIQVWSRELNKICSRLRIG